jgi:hypothetical protein
MKKFKLDIQTLNQIKGVAHDYYIEKNIIHSEADYFVTLCYAKATLDVLQSKGFEIEVMEPREFDSKQPRGAGEL